MRYHLILPPTWILVPVRDDTGAAIKRHVDALFDPKKRDMTVRARRTLRTTLERIAASAREANGLDLLLPVTVPWPMPLSAGIVTSVHPVSPDLTLGEPFETFGGTARRELTDLVELGDPGDAREPDLDEVADVPIQQLRRVTYTWAVPDRPTESFLATLSISGQAVPAYTPLVDTMTELVDTILTTMTWEPARD